jgi:hypothetical protein
MMATQNRESSISQLAHERCLLNPHADDGLSCQTHHPTKLCAHGTADPKEYGLLTMRCLYGMQQLQQVGENIFYKQGRMVVAAMPCCSILQVKKRG